MGHRRQTCVLADRIAAGGRATRVDRLCSLLRYADPELVASAVERALSQGFCHIKLHEVRLDTVAAARAACGESVWLALDTNCPWSVSQSIEHARALEASRLPGWKNPCGRRKTTLAWRVCAPQRRSRLPRARMRPVCTIWQRCYGLDRSTSVAQCQQDWGHRGGSTGAILRACRSITCRTVSLWTGLLASLHLAAAFAPEVAFELFFGDLQASPYHGAVRARQGRLSVPPGPGLGLIRTWSTQSLPPRPPDRDRKLNAEPGIYSPLTLDPWSTV